MTLCPTNLPVTNIPLLFNSQLMSNSAANDPYLNVKTYSWNGSTFVLVSTMSLSWITQLYVFQLSPGGQCMTWHYPWCWSQVSLSASCWTGILDLGTAPPLSGLAQSLQLHWVTADCDCRAWQRVSQVCCGFYCLSNHCRRQFMTVPWCWIIRDLIQLSQWGDQLVLSTAISH